MTSIFCKSFLICVYVYSMTVLKGTEMCHLLSVWIATFTTCSHSGSGSVCACPGLVGTMNKTFNLLKNESLFFFLPKA